MADQRNRLKRLLEYIAEQSKAIDPRSFVLDKSKSFILRRGDVAGLPGVSFDISMEGDYTWLRIERLDEQRPPTLPKQAAALLIVSDDPEGSAPSVNEASLLARVAAQEPANTAEHETLLNQATTEAQEALAAYAPLWNAWAAGERPRRKSIALYGDLFALKQQLETNTSAKAQELVWGMGLSTWRIQRGDDAFSFDYPLVTQQVEVAIDAKSMAIDVRPRAMDARVEMGGYVACQVVGAAEAENAARQLLTANGARPLSPFDRSTYEPILKLVAGTLDSKGEYRLVSDQGADVPPPGPNLVVTDAWVLLSRPRSNNYLTDDLLRLIAKLNEGGVIPPGPAAIVTEPSDQPVQYTHVQFRGVSSRGSGASKAQELYFPLPYNSEQVAVISRLEAEPGVTVQGPPGTGKTHTIGNILCHYLATGRRVLVTSRGEQALEVLQSKIPEEVRPLTVALLADDREGQRQFQGAIEAIQHQISQLNPQETEEAIRLLTAAIDRAHGELNQIDGRIDEIALRQIEEIEVDGVPMRAQKLADLVIHGEDEFAWFDDDLTLDAKHAPPLTELEAAALREARRKLGNDLVYATAEVPAADDLLQVDEVSELHEILRRMNELENLCNSGAVPELKTRTAEVLAAAREMLELVEQAKEKVEILQAVDDGWPLQLRIKCRLPSFATERQALESLFVDIDALIAARSAFLQRPVEIPAAGLRAPKTREAVNRAADTGKPFSLLSLGNSEAKQHIAEVKVAGLPPADQNDWKHVSAFLALHDKLLSFLTRWNQFAQDLSVPRLEGDISVLRRIEMVATAARDAHHLGTHMDVVLVKKGEVVFAQTPTKELLSGAAELGKVRDYLLHHLTRAELAQAAIQLATLKEKLAGKSGPVIDRLREFIDGTLGNSSFPAERAAAIYAELLAELRRIQSLRHELATVREAAARIAAAGASLFAVRIATVPVKDTGEDDTYPTMWRQAWNWARMRTHLDRIEARSELVRLASRRADLETGLMRLYKDMVAKSAWLATKRNASPKVLQALAGYATAIRRIGMGTGPNAMMYRRDARLAMQDAFASVPCWIMNHSRISEAMPAELGLFDLVIVDEASQSDLWALPAILRGKKVLVVGDDKQVSPDVGFISSEQILSLRARFLYDQPFEAAMTPTSSLYDLACRTYASSQIMLREHFRCVPAIIAYSNRTFYDGAVMPLRIPQASERIDPPLVDIYVPYGVRRRDINQLEAQAIADEITAILANPKLAGRTIGVVSLLGDAQAKHIDSLVRKQCDAAELYHRKFECGDARTFQGSERDIMFLSLVVDAVSAKALSGNMFEQRFNVGASRARDRMYLVRSVTATQLSDKDLRLSLLKHFDKPMVVDAEEAELLIERCESGFERDVFQTLTGRGYRVIPQVKTGAYRIDMVVEGENDARLAIECDGDDFHGPDKWQQDMKRQRILERAGWTFWRCFASTWALHRDDVLAELVDRLDTMGIAPIGAIEKAPALVEKRIWGDDVKTAGSDRIAELVEQAIEAVK